MAAPHPYPYMEHLIQTMIETINFLLDSPAADVERLRLLHMSAIAIRQLWYTNQQVGQIQGAIQMMQAGQMMAMMQAESVLGTAMGLPVGMKAVGGMVANGPMGGMPGFGQAAMDPVAAGSTMLAPPIPAPLVAGHPPSAFPPLEAPPSYQTSRGQSGPKKKQRPLSMINTTAPTSPEPVISPGPKPLLLASKATAAWKRQSLQHAQSRSASKVEPETSG